MTKWSLPDIRRAAIAVALLVTALVANPIAAQQTDTHRQFTFSWPFTTDDSMAPRGGTSRGAGVRLASGPSDEWLHLREPGISNYERDRRAILAMAGSFRTSFDFIETVGFEADFVPARPYQSWGTERIYVVADTGDRITLQHILAMFIQNEDGETLGPFVQKHWRQEWIFEPDDLHVFAGHDRWRKLAAQDIAGRWVQYVFQVDDSPRYAAPGKWQHNGSYSAWLSDTTWRPLPRRESSVREDYSVLIGTNRHTILPGGWVQEEENLKTVLSQSGDVDTDSPYVARELGVNRYERIEEFDFSAADLYWRQTQEFWADVRMAWDQVFATRGEFVLHEVVDGVALWQSMFEYAGDVEEDGRYDAADARQFIADTLARHIQ